MFYRKPFVTLSTLLIVLVLLASALPVVAQDGEPTGFRPDAPSYGVRGPYAVGTQEITIDDGNERPLAATIWYPALNPDGLDDTYTYNYEYPNWPPIVTHGHALPDAEMDTAHGPYPLVIFSHGASSYRLHSLYLCEHLASYGFVVISADFADNLATFTGVFPNPPSRISRPADIIRQIDYALSAESLVGMVDAEHIAAMGHSFGAFAALQVGGARLDSANYRTWCEENDFAEAPCEPFLAQEAEVVAMIGLDAVPDDVWPSLGDERVDAVVALAPDNHLFGPDGSALMTLPVMVLAPELDPFWVYDDLGSESKSLVVFENAAHMLFGNGCAAAPFMAEIGFAAFCSDPVWDMDRAHDLINHLVTAFLLAELKGDADAAAVLAPEAVQFPGVSYETTAH